MNVFAFLLALVVTLWYYFYIIKKQRSYAAAKKTAELTKENYREPDRRE
ncbi:MAG: hypothetical protein H6Q74_1282 [Firmicutes bacterium]|nr:hypothetical protein [Bacillota bacterium]